MFSHSTSPLSAPRFRFRPWLFLCPPRYLGVSLGSKSGKPVQSACTEQYTCTGHCTYCTQHTCPIAWANVPCQRIAMIMDLKPFHKHLITSMADFPFSKYKQRIGNIQFNAFCPFLWSEIKLYLISVSLIPAVQCTQVLLYKIQN